MAAVKLGHAFLPPPEGAGREGNNDMTRGYLHQQAWNDLFIELLQAGNAF